MSTYEDGLWILDVTDRSTPRWLGHMETDRYVMALEVAGHHAFLLLDPDPDNVSPGQLVSLDTSNPGLPTVLDRFDLVDWLPQDVGLSGHYAYVSGTLGLGVVDVSDPKNLTRAGYTAHDLGPYKNLIAVSGSDLFVARDHSYDWVRFDVADPVNPKYLGEVSVVELLELGLNSQVFGFTVNGDLAYFIGAPIGGPVEEVALRVVDLGNIGQPRLLTSFPPSPIGYPRTPICMDSGVSVLVARWGGVAQWLISPGFADLQVVSDENARRIRWDLGTLQFSATVNGPWIDLPTASPFQLAPIGDKGFFRVKVEP